MTRARNIMAPTCNPDHPDCPGWAVFEAEGSLSNSDGRRPLQLQRWDELDVFEDDKQAHEAVLTAASEGCPTARLALRFVRRFSPAEYATITGESA